VNNIRDYLSQLGKKGGAARAKKLSLQQRIESARKAANARWKKSERKLGASIEKTTALLQKLEKKNKLAKKSKKDKP
jgi:hypothetical protein